MQAMVLTQSALAALDKGGLDLLKLAAEIPLHTQTQEFPLALANGALQALKHDGINGLPFRA